MEGADYRVHRYSYTVCGYSIYIVYPRKKNIHYTKCGTIRCGLPFLPIPYPTSMSQLELAWAALKPETLYSYGVHTLKKNSPSSGFHTFLGQWSAPSGPLQGGGRRGGKEKERKTKTGDYWSMSSISLTPCGMIALGSLPKLRWRAETNVYLCISMHLTYLPCEYEYEYEMLARKVRSSVILRDISWRHACNILWLPLIKEYHSGERWDLRDLQNERRWVYYYSRGFKRDPLK